MHEVRGIVAAGGDGTLLEGQCVGDLPFVVQLDRARQGHVVHTQWVAAVDGRQRDGVAEDMHSATPCGRGAGVGIDRLAIGVFFGKTAVHGEGVHVAVVDRALHEEGRTCCYL